MFSLARNRRRPLLMVTGLLLAGGALILTGSDRQANAGGCRTHNHGHGEVAASHILVSWNGTKNHPEGLNRTREQAHERARRISVYLRTGRSNFADMARRFSDDPTADRNNGYLGVFVTSEMDGAFEELVASLDIGEIGGPVETPYGFHVVRRERARRVHAHHLLVAHRDAIRAPEDVRRDRQEADRIANALRTKILQDDVDRCDLTARFSDDHFDDHRCGELGWIEPGLLEPEAERAVFGLQAGEVSPVVETEYGFHIFWRD